VDVLMFAVRPLLSTPTVNETLYVNVCPASAVPNVAESATVLEPFGRIDCEAGCV
jgi:hypothetical protein